jgi:hypothetical protein
MTEIDKLREEIEALTARMDELEHGLTRGAKIYGGYFEALQSHCMMLDRDQAGAFQRIKHLELTVFPKLARDIQDVHDIIGEGEDKAENPLDHPRRS